MTCGTLPNSISKNQLMRYCIVAMYIFAVKIISEVDYPHRSVSHEKVTEDLQLDDMQGVEYVLPCQNLTAGVATK